MQRHMSGHRGRMALTKSSDQGAPDQQGLAAIAVRKDASWQVHHQAGNGVH